jgi:hypothetical protein
MALKNRQPEALALQGSQGDRRRRAARRRAGGAHGQRAPEGHRADRFRRRRLRSQRRPHRRARRPQHPGHDQEQDRPGRVARRRAGLTRAAATRRPRSTLAQATPGAAGSSAAAGRRNAPTRLLRRPTRRRLGPATRWSDVVEGVARCEGVTPAGTPSLVGGLHGLGGGCKARAFTTTRAATGLRGKGSARSNSGGRS